MSELRNHDNSIPLPNLILVGRFITIPVVNVSAKNSYLYIEMNNDAGMGKN